MTIDHPSHRGVHRRHDAPISRAVALGARRLAGACLVVFGLAACGGSNPLDNAPSIDNPTTTGGQVLSFAFFQKCINPIFLEQLPIPGTALTNTCAAGGCHDNVSGSGGALRITPGATPVTIDNPPAVDAIHASDMYRNFLSAQGQVVFAEPSASRLIAKPLVQGVLHGGGRIFSDENDPKVQLILYWMSHPAAQGQDEFSTPAPATCP